MPHQPPAVIQRHSPRAAMPLTRRPAQMTIVADIPLPGAAVRFDYLSLDPQSGRLYIAHMNADAVVAVDVARRAVVAQARQLDDVHGVLAVPALGRLFATVTGQHAVVALDAQDLRELARSAGLDYPDGLAYVPASARLFVSDEHGDADLAFDARSLRQLGRVDLGGEAGNTVFDPGSGCVLVAVHEPNELAAIDPNTLAVVAHLTLPGVDQPHGIALDIGGGSPSSPVKAMPPWRCWTLATAQVLADARGGRRPGRARL